MIRQKRTPLCNLLAHRGIRLVIPVALIITVATASTYAHTIQPVKIRAPAKSPHIVAQKLTAKPVTSTSTVTTPAPAPAAVSSTAKTVSKTASAPVVVPASTSSVTNLVPTDPVVTAPSSSAPGSSSSSSSGSSNSTTSAPPATTTSYTSSNWSGYLAASSNYTAVNGSWIIPSPTGTSVNMSADATWIGIGGVTSGDLIQIGTDNTVSPSGQVSAEAFYEMLPAASVPVPNLTVSPGDAMSASIVETSPGQWLMTIIDTTSGQTYSNIVSYASSNSSAEWIEEDPSYSNGRQVPFDYFGSASFSQVSMVANSNTQNLTGGSAAPITILSRSSRATATPSAIGFDDASFTVTRNQ